MHLTLFRFLLLCLLLGAVEVYAAVASKCKEKKGYGKVVNAHPKPDRKSPNLFLVSFDTDVMDQKGNTMPPIVIMVNRTLSPNGADRLYSLVRDNYFQNAAFFRVAPNFMVQFGIAADPAETKKWDTNIQDDHVIASNTKGMVSFATSGANTRTTQIFINAADNKFLDKQGFSPFGWVKSGQETLARIHNPTPADTGGVDQGKLTAEGNKWLLKQYPLVNSITCTKHENADDTAVDFLATGTSAGETVAQLDPSFAGFRNVFAFLFPFAAFLICFDLDGRYYLSICAEPPDRGSKSEQKALLDHAVRSGQALV